MDLMRYIAPVLKWWWLIVLATCLAAASSYWSTSNTPKTYQASTTLRVGRFLESADPQLGDFTTSQQLAQVYAEAARRQPILQAAAERLGLAYGWDTLARQVEASAPAGSQLLFISVTDTSPERAAAIAAEVANQLILQSPTVQDMEQEQRRQFVEQQLVALEKKVAEAEKNIAETENAIAGESSAVRIREMQNRILALQQQITGWQATYGNLLDFYKGSRTNYLSVIDPATVPTQPAGPNVPANVVLAAAVGFLLATGAALVVHYVDDTLNSVDDVDRVLAYATVGQIPRIGRITNGNTLVGLREPLSAAAEAFRVLQTNVEFQCLDEDRPMLLVTSAGRGEGKSVTAANLAVSFAQAGKRVILVDADLRKPTLHKHFGASREIGLTSLFLDEPPQVPAQPARGNGLEKAVRRHKTSGVKRKLEEYLLSTGVPTLRVLASGPQPPNPSALLGSPMMEQVLAFARDLADVIIVDSPPLLPVADAVQLAARVPNVLLVAEAGRTRSHAARLARRSLNGTQARVVGVVLNKMPIGPWGYYHGYYYGTAQRGRLFGFLPVLGRRLARAGAARARPTPQDTSALVEPQGKSLSN